ncbi:uncharacterized protein Z520_05718 [Fonsecaea multimorphosa CBS 102226]|uniref:Transcription factor TFIIIC triple barrel domain-containing protein n=1 Tax=Fonsecaea multimorphosa CBS 102226 TaxID=1442371 RepID=A0A0D2JY51_9EURO|nr:uncharacterized protein Z520_05718 [Fonsecaea multimorphosa CBS 102226]KIX98417.1 hypothetical protein Z520_05718 [Fonsecaea multimorphosa CBS 102226]OAL24611.1 hypothetical protein AYO22_05400 [Fonsecaea multimorphosa]
MDLPKHPVDDDSEYEYDETETETFFVDIDLSSLNSNIKSNPSAPPKPVTPAKRKRPNSSPPTPGPGPDEPGAGAEAADSAAAGEGRGSTQEPQELHETPSQNGEDIGEDADAHLPSPSRVQILDLATVNPIISYQGQVYSCMWADMVGTNMFFTHPGMLDAAEVLRSTDDYDLIGVSRIKLVGHTAKMLKKEKPTKEARTDDQLVSNGQAGVSGEVSEARHGQDQTKKQASFLEKLIQVKRQRGESDIVRTFVDEKTAALNVARVHESHRDEIQDLNVQVLGGNPDALVRLQQIYSQSDGKASQMQESSERPVEAHDEADITI